MAKNTSRRDFLKTAGVASLMTTSVGACAKRAQADSHESDAARPNVVLVLTDDQG